jgi:hypothetical protein
MDAQVGEVVRVRLRAVDVAARRAVFEAAHAGARTDSATDAGSGADADTVSGAHAATGAPGGEPA